MRAVLRAAIFLGVVTMIARPVPGSAQAEPVDYRGHTFQTAGPDSARAAVIVVHDWFGVSAVTIESVERLAALGYRALAVDLYHGETAITAARAGQLLGALDQDDASSVIGAAVEYLSTHNRPVALVSFSAGSLPALTAATTHESIVAMASVYGGNLENVDAARLQSMGARLLLISGSEDAWALGSIEIMQARMEGVGKTVEVYVFPNAGHGYAQPLWDGGANLDAEATRVTWELIEEFLRRHTGL